MRIGYGYDIHQLAEGRKLYIGGIEIPCAKGLLGHSDADVLLHAICDSLLGAAGLGDIGEHFPDTDPSFKDIAGLELLKTTVAMVGGKGYEIENVDCIVFAETVKITPYKAKIKDCLKAVLNISPARINIKAKTMEGLDSVGQNKAIAAASMVLLKEKF
ncbi:MAG: 2-C-methyl-D-erythritol 2,4-cyclodiphosphate synthase [Candidatus Omnitrophica bacterium]|nr:2-C-methyl-D-erythritol 2,4-cyclodiphosphate synthase [Candidatus Omnitrophota bacterium]MBU4479149.1 2-C-methyl-D-erythritol 2,4-cyclodiphosphate synthase [Candidatus Omnitrophota bacterium]MCG2702788.1 2-C-methyl-D-erythritol 2,4-cyclodiphosphate synthase [Candidatus Omnitrophota bacterium]